MTRPAVKLLAPSATLLTVAGFVLVAAAFWAVVGLWPDTSGYSSEDQPVGKAQAVIAGGVLLVGACVCWVGAVLTGRMDWLIGR